MAITLGELATTLGCDLVGSPDIVLSSVAPLGNAHEGSISFYANRAFADELSSTTASAVIVQETDLADCPVAALVSDNPYLSYARVTGILYPDAALNAGVHPSAVVDAQAAIDSSAEISANAVIGKDVNVGKAVFIGPGVVVGDGCRIGEYSRLMANCTLVQDVELGSRCIVHAGAVIGADGFGNAMSPAGWVKVRQVGGVRIGDDVEIGSNSTIDRGAIGNTIIEDGVRIDNLVQIAHNVQVGAHTAMAAMTGIAGSTVIGKRCLFAGRSGAVGHVTICDDVIVGADTFLSKDVTEAGFYSGSFPAEKDRDWKRNVARFRRLDKLTKRVQDLEKGS